MAVHQNKPVVDPSNVGSSAIELLKGTRIEPLVLVHTFAYAVRSIAIMQLYQDKLCIQKYGETRELCTFLSSSPSTPTKDAILADASLYNTYKEFGVIIPATISALFIGSFCDRFKYGCRYTILSTLFCQLLETLFLLLHSFFFDWDPFYLVISFILPSFFGNDFGLFTSVYAYTAATVKPADRAIKYLLIIISLTLGFPLGGFAGGFIIKQRPILNSQQLQNYAGTFLVSGVCTLSAIIYTLLVIKGTYSDNKCQTTSTQPSSSSESTSTEDGTSTSCDLETDSESKSLIQKESFWTKVKVIFDIGHLKDVYTAAVKKRDGNIRLRMWFVVIAINLNLLTFFGAGAVTFSLVQKLYLWDSVVYSNFSSIVGVIHMIALCISIPIVRLFSLNDMQTALIGCVSHLLGLICLGSITNPVGFWMNAVISSFAGLAGTGCRAYLSKILPKDDVAKIFAVTLVIEAIEKCFGSYIFAVILSFTISCYATFVYHFLAGVLVFALVILVYTDLKTPYPI